jgi:hypothetical protein
MVLVLWTTTALFSYMLLVLLIFLIFLHPTLDTLVLGDFSFTILLGSVQFMQVLGLFIRRTLFKNVLEAFLNFANCSGFNLLCRSLTSDDKNKAILSTKQEAAVSHWLLGECAVFTVCRFSDICFQCLQQSELYVIVAGLGLDVCKLE